MYTHKCTNTISAPIETRQLQFKLNNVTFRIGQLESRLFIMHTFIGLLLKKTFRKSNSNERNKYISVQCKNIILTRKSNTVYKYLQVGFG